MQDFHNSRNYKVNFENQNKIFGIGLSKTATTSLAGAMKILGYKSKHYLLNPPKDISEHEFINDMPVQTRYQEYDKEYPGSKFILTIRDKDCWLSACKRHFCKPIINQHFIFYKYRIEQTGIDGYDENIFSKKYDEHVKCVEEYFKKRKDDLLIINICGGDGWDKLCAFLGKEVPKQPFPKLNVSKHGLLLETLYKVTTSKEETSGVKFNTALYIASNAKLIESIGYNLEAAQEHYQEEGFRNNSPVNLFDPQSYLKKYADLSSVFGDDLFAATRHYIVSGYKEGRFWTDDISVVEAVLQRDPQHIGAQREKFLKKLQSTSINQEILSKVSTDRIGIGIITYNRLEHLKGCVESIKKYTQIPYYLVIADDGSTDGTAEWCRSENLSFVSGQNRGVCWNKNRALYALKEYTDANCIILLEDDCWPMQKEWELSWLQTTAIWHHVNYAAPWIFTHKPESVYQKSNGTPACPYLLKLLTGQCTSSSRHALNSIGYLDSRFRGYGHGHTEWTNRFMNCSLIIESLPIPISKVYPAINTGLATQKSLSYSNDAERQKNAQVFTSLINEPIYRLPWQNDEEKFLFIEEVNSARQSILKQVSKINPAILSDNLNLVMEDSTLPKPRMSEAEASLYAKYLKEKNTIIEFGSGGSTVLAVKTGVNKIYSVESDLEFVKKLQEYALIRKAVQEGQVKFCYVDIGPVFAWGFPVDSSFQKNWPAYYSSVWNEVSDHVDLVLIDGRFRVACALQSLSHVDRGSVVVIHDFWNRPNYHDVLKFFDVIESVDTIVFLKPKDEIDQHLLSDMIERYKYVTN